jgi:hypothetical protein
MALRKSYRSRFLRELWQSCVVFVCAAGFVGGLIYFVDWSQAWPETKGQSQSNISSQGTDEQRYSGSIILPARGGRCWEAVFDNRTGRIIDKGDAKCDKPVLQLPETNQAQDFDAIRLHEVGKAFRHE